MYVCIYIYIYIYIYMMYIQVLSNKYLSLFNFCPYVSTFTFHGVCDLYERRNQL